MLVLAARVVVSNYPMGDQPHVTLQNSENILPLSAASVEAAPLAFARDKRTLLYALSLLLDLAALIGGYACALQVRDEQWLAAGGHSIVVLAVPIFTLIAIAREAQSAESLQNRLLGTQRSLGALGASAIIIVSLAFMFGSAEEISRLGLALTFGFAGMLIVLGKIIVDIITKHTLGDSVLATILILDGLDAKPDGPAMVVDVAALGLWPDLDRPEVIDTLSRLVVPFDRVVVACCYEHRAAWSIFLKGHDVGGEILLDRDVLHGAVSIANYDNRDTIILSLGPLGLMNRIQKRALDLVVASLALLMLSPLLLTVAVAIQLESPGPAFFRQMRVGQGNRQFRIYKFRSMYQDKGDSVGARSTGRLDNRITRVGRFIRRTSIDELPQLLNVLRGQMSIVGPRPHALGSTAGNELFWRASQLYWLRHALKPGITGLAQIRGFRGSTEQVNDLEQRVRCDLEYLSNWSLMSDIIILMKTVRVVMHKNAY